MEEQRMKIQVQSFDDPLVGYVSFTDPLLGRELAGRTVTATIEGVKGEAMEVSIREFEDPIFGHIRFEEPPRELLRRLEEQRQVKMHFPREGDSLHISY